VEGIEGQASQPVVSRRRDVDGGRLTMISFRAQSSDAGQAQRFREQSSVGPPGLHPMEPDPKTAGNATEGLRALAQPVAAPLTRAAIFLVVTLKPGSEVRSVVRSFCADLSAILRAVETRDLEAALSCIMGIGSEAWDRLFGSPRPALLHPFREIRSGGRHAVSTPGDLLFHIRSKRMDLCFELATQIMARIGEAVSPEDEVQGFRYFDDRDLIGFVDGTENPRGQEAVDAVTIGDEDAAFSGGSYVIVQKYFHDMARWDALPVEAQERIIGRKKLSDIELDASVKPSSSHSSLTTIVVDGKEMKILRDNMPFGRPTQGEFGTYFIGYSRDPAITEQMLENMFVGRPPGNYDRLLDFSRAITGTLFFVPSASFLDDVSDEEAADADSSTTPDADSAAMPAADEPSAPVQPANDGSLGIGSLKGDPQ
jgi:putative iron-dependent peroxidase